MDNMDLTVCYHDLAYSIAVLILTLVKKMVLVLDDIGRDLLRSQIEWVTNCIEKDINAKAAECAGCKVGEPTQSARAAL